MKKKTNKIKTVLVTGSSGFIGFHTVIALLSKNFKVVGIDNHNSYYDVNLKKDRLKKIRNHPRKKNFSFFKVDISNKKKILDIFKKFKFDYIINLAAQAGVRYSLKNPNNYLKNNISGFLNILEISKQFGIKHLVYASTSSVYGANSKLPFSEKDGVDHPIQFYAVTKRCNELMAHAYSYLHNIPTSGLRFFTVYGPWGRPDMALFIFTKNILKNIPIPIFNYGKHLRDFSYVSDIVEGILRILTKPPKKKNNIKANPSNSSSAPFRIVNIGNNKPETLMNYIEEIEKNLDKKSIKNFLPLQKGDVKQTFSNIDMLKSEFKYTPKTNIKTGVKKFIHWYKSYYKKKL